MSDELDAFHDPWQRDQDLELADKIYSAAGSELSQNLRERMIEVVEALLARHGYDQRIFASSTTFDDAPFCPAE